MSIKNVNKLMVELNCGQKGLDRTPSIYAGFAMLSFWDSNVLPIYKTKNKFYSRQSYDKQLSV